MQAQLLILDLLIVQIKVDDATYEIGYVNTDQDFRNGLERRIERAPPEPKIPSIRHD